MGNSSRSPEDYQIVSKYRETDWIHERNEQGLQIWRHRLTNEVAELVRLGGVPSSTDLDIYTTRTMENDLVKVYHILIDSQSDMCALYNTANLLIEHIPLRLATLRNFDREQALTIFAAALRGFHLLEIKFGPIVPHEQLISFNEQGKTKVWLNRNSCLNYAENRAFNEEMIQQGATRVQMLFEMIEQRARYVLLPPVIKEEIYHPLSTHLSALKVLEKFAYYEKLNLRKYLQLGHCRISSEAQHIRNRSNFTDIKTHQQIYCEKSEVSAFSSGGKDELRRNYSLNNIHNRPNYNTFYVPQQIAVGKRSDLELFKKNSIFSNNSSYIESARPSTVIIHSPPPILLRPAEHVSNLYHRQGSKNVHSNLFSLSPEDEKQKETVVKNVQIEPLEVYHQDRPPKQQSVLEHDHRGTTEQPTEDVENLQECKILLNNKPLSIIQKLDSQEDIIKIEQNQNNQPVIGSQHESLEPKSPTFVRFQEVYEPLSFAPSRHHFEETTQGQHLENDQQTKVNLTELEHKMDSIANQQTNRDQTSRNDEPLNQTEEERRLSIQNKAPKLEFAPDFQLSPGSLLNYCTSVESKFHMATNREHSIIDTKPKEQPSISIHKYKDDQLEQYIREKYSTKEETKLKVHPKDGKDHHKVKRIQSRYVTVNQSPTEVTHVPSKFQTSLNAFPVQHDFLDVNFLEKSLDKRYNNESLQMREEEKRRKQEQNDALNIAKLEQGLLRFSKSQLSQKNSEQAASKDLATKKVEHSEHTIEHSTGFDSYYPFKEKKINQQSKIESFYISEKPINRGSVHRRSSKYQDDIFKKKYLAQQRQQYNVQEYSFEDENKNKLQGDSQKYITQPNKNYYIKETQFSAGQYHPKQKNYGDNYEDVKPIDLRGKKPRLSAEEERTESRKQTQHTIPSSRKISYEQLRQFLWN